MIPPPPLQKRVHDNLERAFETLRVFDALRRKKNSGDMSNEK